MKRCLYTYKGWMSLGIMDSSMGLGLTTYVSFQKLLNELTTVIYGSDRHFHRNFVFLTEREIDDEFPDKHLMFLKSKFNHDEPWYVDFVNYIVGKVVPPNWTFEKRKRFFSQVKTYFWEEPCAFKLCAYNILRRCVAGSETLEILAHYHSGPTDGHHSASVTAKKVCQSGFYWPSVIKDASEYVRRCD
ncbi:reverse transcriptase domain-containing protein [Tanacetum coccineum]